MFWNAIANVLNQYMHALTILMKLLRHELLLTMTLRYLQDNLLGLGVEALLHLLMELLNSSSENRVHWVTGLFGISSNKSILTWWFCTELNNMWRACHRLSSSKQGCLLYLIVSIAGSLHFLIQFMSFQEPLFLPTISWILESKNTHLVFLTMLLKVFQSSNHLKVLYFSSSLWYFLFHYNFECLVILTTFEWLNQILFVLLVLLVQDFSYL